MSIIFSIFAILVGYILTTKSNWFLNNFGRVQWAEMHMGAEGGSRLFYKLLGLAIIIIALLTITDFLPNLLLKFLSPFFQF